MTNVMPYSSNSQRTEQVFYDIYNLNPSQYANHFISAFFHYPIFFMDQKRKADFNRRQSAKPAKERR